MSSSSPDSLVKYGTAILVSTQSKKGMSSKKKPLMPDPKIVDLDKNGQQLPQRNEDYLNSILPPREYTEDGQLWVRYVSPTPATKVDVLTLQDELDKKL
mmetsp:Transcript_34001/g.24537  ORF Transcript_34001/g.24537 Transcript_34001/m.24537 type:complete len:99 (-) Transcript_34001:485-781(-)